MVLVEELPMEFWRKSCTKCFFFLHFGASDFPSKNPFKKCFKIFFFSLWRLDPVLKLQFPTPLRVVLLCFATHIVMAASRLLPALAVCVSNTIVFCSWTL